MSKSDALENDLLDLVLGGGSYTPEATVWIALYTVAPNDTGGGTEVSGSAYARVAVTNNATNWPAASSGQKTNGTAFAFPQATGTWGTIVAFGIHGHATADELLYWGVVDPERAVLNGGEPSFAIGDLVVTED